MKIQQLDGSTITCETCEDTVDFRQAEGWELFRKPNINKYFHICSLCMDIIRDQDHRSHITKPKSKFEQEQGTDATPEFSTRYNHRRHTYE